jgi:Na+-driven multidrug efflux pump
MRTMTKYRFTSFWAALQVVTGLVWLGLSLGLALAVAAGAGLGAVGLPEPSSGARSLIALAVVLIGLFGAGPFIVSGQLLQIFLDQRRLLAAIHRRLRRMEETEREREALERAVRREPPRRA